MQCQKTPEILSIERLEKTNDSPVIYDKFE